MIFLVFTLIVSVFTVLSFLTLYFGELSYRHIKVALDQKQKLLTGKIIILVIGFIILGYYFIQNLIVAIQRFGEHGILQNINAQEGALLGYVLGVSVYFVMKKQKKLF